MCAQRSHLDGCFARLGVLILNRNSLKFLTGTSGTSLLPFSLRLGFIEYRGVLKGLKGLKNFEKSTKRPLFTFCLLTLVTIDGKKEKSLKQSFLIHFGQRKVIICLQQTFTKLLSTSEHLEKNRKRQKRIFSSRFDKSKKGRVRFLPPLSTNRWRPLIRTEVFHIFTNACDSQYSCKNTRLILKHGLEPSFAKQTGNDTNHCFHYFVVIFTG